MELLRKEEFEKLAAFNGENCISIYIPTHRKGEEVTSGKDALLFKNQLQKVKVALIERGMHESKVREYLAPAFKLHEDTGFWRKQLEGLAVFIGKDHFSYHRLPISFSEFCSVTTSFNLLPIVPIFSDDGLYYILALSQDRVRLLRASRHYINEIDTGDTLQQGIIEVYKYYDFESGIQNQSSSQGGGHPGPGTVPQGGGGPNPTGNRGGASFHGQGDNKSDKSRPLIIEYFRNLNEGLRIWIPNDRVPVVLVAVDYLHQMYQEASNGFPYKLMDKGVTGNPDQLQAKELHEKTWLCVEDYFEGERERSRQAYQELAGTGRTSYDINEIVPAAVNGRIDSLFVADGSRTWGRFDESSQGVEIHEEFEYGDDDLINKSAINTILNSGQAFVIDPNEFPDKTVNAPMVAIMRF